MFDTTELGTPGASAAALLESIDPRALADLDLVAYAQAAERQVAHATALSLRASLLVAERAQARLLGEIDRADQDLGGPTPAGTRVELARRAGVHELQQALHLSPTAAINRLHRAGALAGSWPPPEPCWRPGAHLPPHLVLLDHTLGLDQRVTAGLQAKCLRRAPQQTPGDFGRSLTRALHARHPTAPQRATGQARNQAGVRKTDTADGMAALVITATDPDTEWAYTVLDTLAPPACTRPTRPASTTASPGRRVRRTKRRPGDAAFLPLAADVGPAPRGGVLLPGGTRRHRPDLPHQPRQAPRRDPGRANPGHPARTPRRPATINGRSVPADIAREMATGTTALRRLVTDPVTGHLLNYGTTREPPTALAEFLLARDRECRVPNCHIRASACDLDHATPWDTAAPAAARTWAHCPVGITHSRPKAGPTSPSRTPTAPPSTSPSWANASRSHHAPSSASRSTPPTPRQPKTPTPRATPTPRHRSDRPAGPEAARPGCSALSGCARRSSHWS